ncbi:MAG: peptide-methionine (R)-S-oxide reductase MsrB [Patescibacteria group bacterium]
MKKIEKTNEEWKKILPPDVYHITREGGTEIPFTGELLHNKENGMYTCSNCGQELFESNAKFDSGTGWPSFDKTIPNATEEHPDTSMGMNRTEVVCSRCGAHLGHLFDDLPRLASSKAGGPTDTRTRLCINSCALKFAKTNSTEFVRTDIL